MIESQSLFFNFRVKVILSKILSPLTFWSQGKETLFHGKHWGRMVLHASFKPLGTVRAFALTTKLPTIGCPTPDIEFNDILSLNTNSHSVIGYNFP